VKRIIDEQRAYVDKLERETQNVIRWIFPYPDGRHIRNPEFWFRRAAKAAGCPDLHIHDLRRFAVSRMVERGIPDADAMELAGMETRSILDTYNIT
jgi:integrase